MAIPFAAALIGSTGAGILDYALGRPLNLWGQQIAAGQAPDTRRAQYDANYGRANVIPPPDAILEALRRGFLSESVARNLLNMSGVAWGAQRLDQHGRQNIGPELLPASAWNFYRDAWEQVAKMRRSRPGPETVMRLWLQSRLRPPEWDALSSGLDWDSNLYAKAVLADHQSPGIEEVTQLWRLNRISDGDYLQAAAQLGWYDRTALNLRNRVAPLPPLSTLMRQWFLGRVNDEEYSRYARALGHVDDRSRQLYESQYYNIPSGPELVNLAVRDAWNQQVVDRWGYDDEFPPEMQFWMRAQGWDWGQAIPRDGQAPIPAVHWPKLFWRAHWQVIPPGLAYQMYRRLRPERLDRYRGQFRDITPFTLDDLRTVLKVHDYPPRAREWLAALNSQPLRMYTIRTAYRQRVRDREWATQQLLDSGYLRLDAEVILDTIDREQQYKEEQALLARARRLNSQTADEVIAGFKDGLVPRETAAQRLSNLGWGATMASQALNLAESQELRQTARAVIRALRRDYIAGSMSALELQDRLVLLPLSQAATARYLQRWEAERSLRRRALSSAQVLSLVSAGALDAPTALERLANLGWVDPDASLLTGQATVKALRAAAHAQELLARKDQAQRKALEAAARQAQSAANRAKAELRRITPLGIVRAWYQRGLRTAPWVRIRLLAMGLDTASIDTYLVQWSQESYDKLLGATQPAADIAKILHKQTPLSTIKRLWQTGVVTDSWARRRLNDSGYTPESIELYVASWRQSLTPKQSGPAPEGSPIPATKP